MKVRPVSVAVVVKDRARARRWYTEKLGLKVLADEPEHWTVVGRPKSGMHLHLCEYEGGRGPTAAERDIGLRLTIDGDFRAATRRLARRGVVFTVPPTKRPWGWVAQIRDPDGNLLHLAPAD